MGPSDDLNNPYVVSSIVGTGVASKILITDSENNIKNINKLSANNLKIKDTKLELNNIYSLSIFYFNNEFEFGVSYGGELIAIKKVKNT